MPKLLAPDNVLTALEGKKYDEVIALIKANANLVNCVNEFDASLLQQIAKMAVDEKAAPLIKFILNHDKLDWTQVAAKGEAKGETNLTYLIKTRRLDILKMLQDNPRILYSLNRLSYEHAVNKLKDAMTSLTAAHARQDRAEAIATRERIVKGYQEVVPYLRDVTILQAIATDSTKLMDDLEKAGAKPKERLAILGNNALPADLLKPTNHALLAWFKPQLPSAAQQLAEQQAKLAPAAAPVGTVLNSVKTAPAITLASAGVQPFDNFTPSGAPKVSKLSMLLSLENQKKALTVKYHNDKAQVSAGVITDIHKVLNSSF